MASPLQTADQELLGRIRGGDRAAVAEFVRGHEPLIRRRFRHKLGAALRRVVDSEELVSTLSRRLDAYMAMGHLSATTEQQLWALVMRIAERSVFDKLRELQRSPTATSASPEYIADADPAASFDDVEAELRSGPKAEEILRLIPEGDREIAAAWMRGLDFKVIGQQMGMSADTARQKWHRIKLELRKQMEAR